MRSTVRAALLAGAIVAGFGSAAVFQPAVAQTYVSFDYFHDQLSASGAWLYSDRWGMVWQPQDVPDDFRPYYTAGHWVYTSDYGWMWDSDYDWGDIAFHYGRWVNDPDDGWMWIPGYTWAPSWVVWRTNNDYVGWMPMPPDRSFVEGAGLSIGGGGLSISFGWNSDPYYGYRSWYGGDYDDRRFASNWVFVGYGHVADRDYGRYAVRDPVRTINIVRQTQTVVNYTVVNNYVVNRGIDVRRVEQVARRPVAALPARQVMRRPNLIASIAAGQHAREQARQIAPMGHGVANSAPPPPPQIVERLSARPPKAHGGHPPAHLFAKTEISNPAVVATHFHGKPQAAPVHADTARPDNAHADMGRPGNAHADMARPGNAHADMGRPGNPHMDVAHPGNGHNDAGHPGSDRAAPPVNGHPPVEDRKPMTAAPRSHPDKGWNDRPGDNAVRGGPPERMAPDTERPHRSVEHSAPPPNAPSSDMSRGERGPNAFRSEAPRGGERPMMHHEDSAPPRAGMMAEPPGRGPAAHPHENAAPPPGHADAHPRHEEGGKGHGGPKEKPKHDEPPPPH